MTTATRTDAYETTIKTVSASSDLRTSVQAAKDLGISTRKFTDTAYRNQIVPTIVTGTEKNKYPVYVFTPEQVEQIANLSM